MAVLKCIPIHGSAGSPTYAAGDIRDMLAALLGGTNFEAVSPAVGAVARGHGVLSFPSMAVTANGTPNNHVFVAPGLASVRGTQSNDQGPYICPLSSSFDITVPAAHATLDRRDLIVAQVKDGEFAAFSGTFLWTPELKQGTPAGSPVDPTVTEDCLVLARLLVRDSTEAGGTIVRPQDITDLRVHARANGGVTPVATLASWPSPQSFDMVWSIADDGLYVRNAANSAWRRVSEATDSGWTSYTPTVDTLSLGNGTVWGRYKRLGGGASLTGATVVVEAGFKFGTTSVLSGSIGISLPSNARFTGGLTEWMFGARAFDVGSGNYGGIGSCIAATPGKVINFATAGSIGWQGGGSPVPFAWSAAGGDGMSMFGVYEEA
jgi:hypothetical protein